MIISFLFQQAKEKRESSDSRFRINNYLQRPDSLQRSYQAVKFVSAL